MDRPILMSGPLVRATLADQKTQTRRLLRVAIPPHWRAFPPTEPDGLWTMSHIGPQLVITCPYGAVGDHLWVRETWRSAGWRPETDFLIQYAAGPGNGEWRSAPEDTLSVDVDRGHRWRPSIHMPRWASRLTLEVTGVRVERLQDISEADAIAEGLPALDARDIIDTPGTKYMLPCGMWLLDTSSPVPLAGSGPGWSMSAREAFALWWDHINGKRATWGSNPWVWVIEFKRVAQ